MKQQSSKHFLSIRIPAQFSSIFCNIFYLFKIKSFHVKVCISKYCLAKHNHSLFLSLSQVHSTLLPLVSLILFPESYPITHTHVHMNTNMTLDTTVKGSVILMYLASEKLYERKAKGKCVMASPLRFSNVNIRESL